MFKLESYITPIILSYVDKYVKNARADRSQVSLWGGDVVFSNLDLRLDVLEKELGLPFTFVSGHIHELHINVPWTRLNTESIVITINTIECVLRLPDASTASQDGSEGSVRSGGGMGASEKRKLKKFQDQEQDSGPPPGYVQSLISKIISNVKIVCNNLILKYVEDDIVLSLNTRWLCLSPANALWEPAYVEFSLPDLVQRKLFQIKDMTVCLDKRDASGRIDIYQEPFLYRCSMTIHAAWIYDSLNNKIPRVTRYDIRCAKMEFSLTDTQLPMFLRIVKLLLALYYGDFHQKDVQSEEQAVSKPKDFSVDMSGLDDEASMTRNAQNLPSGNWSDWAWNIGSSVGTAILPIYWEDEDEDDIDSEGRPRHASQTTAIQLWRDRITHLGLYVDEASFVFKITEKLSKDVSANNAARFAFTPMLRLDCWGNFMETKAVGVHTVNVSGGVSGIEINPLGDCACGHKDTIPVNPTTPSNNADESESTTSTEQSTKDNNVPKSETRYLNVGDNEVKNFLRGSLFEKDYGDEQGMCKERKCSYSLDWDRHMEEVNEDTMLERTPALALDMLYNLELPDDLDSDRLSALSDLENSDMGERAMTRVVLGPAQVRYCLGASHRFQCMQYFLSKYDYPPYASNVIEPEDIDSENKKTSPGFQRDGKMRVYQLTAINPSIEIYAADHANLSIEESLIRRSRNSKEFLTKKEAVMPFTNVISCQIAVDCLDSKIIVPMYPAKLTKDTDCRNVPDHCYIKLGIKLIQLSSRLIMSSKNLAITWIQPSNVSLQLKKTSLSPSTPLVLQMKSKEISGSLEFDVFRMRLSRPQWLLLLHIYSTWFEKRINGDLNPGLVDDAMTKKLANIVFTLKSFHMKGCYSSTCYTLQSHGQEASLHLGNVPSSVIPLVSTVRASAISAVNLGTRTTVYPISPGRAQNRRQEESREQSWMRLDFQWPTSTDFAKKVVPICALQTGEVHFNFDPKLNDWIAYQPPKIVLEPVPKTIPNPMENKSSNVSCPKRRSKSRSRSPSHAGGGQPYPRQNLLTRSGSHSLTVKPIPTTLDEPSKDMNEKIKSSISEWYDVLNSLLIQVQMDPVYVYAPRKSLAYGAQKVARHVKDAIAQVPVIGIVFPSIILENLAHKPMIQQFLNTMPFVFPESLWNVHRDNLPWTLKLQDFTVYNSSLGGPQNARETLLEPISTSCTLGLNIKTEGFGLCLHADMSPLRVWISEEQLSYGVSLTERVLQFAASIFPHLWTETNQVSDLSTPIGGAVTVTSGEADYVVKMRGVSNMSSVPSQLERPGSFRKETGSAASSEKSRESMKLASDAKKSNDRLSVWVQWTLPQAALTLTTSGHRQRLVFTLEDYQSSFDWNPTFFQSKLRILTASIKHQIEKNQEWKEGPNQSLILTFGTEITSDLETVHGNRVELLSTERQVHLNKTCFTLIFTRAECKNLHARWKEASQKSGKSSKINFHRQEMAASTEAHPRFLCEVDIKVAPVDFVFDIEVFLPFIKMMARPLTMKVPPMIRDRKVASAKSPVQVWGMNVNNNTLPLVYLKVRTIRVFFPAHRSQSVTATTKIEADFLLCHCESINLSPQVDNPISRILVKPDVYHLSDGMLDIPGSQVENRQYQLDLQGGGVFSGNWKEVLKESKTPERPAELKTRSENPALEWNIASTQPHLSQGVILMPLVKKFDLQAVVAPAIVWQRTATSSELIAGHSMEINAQSDVMITSSLGQIQLCSHLMQEVLAAQSVLSFQTAYGRPSTLSLAASSDSGVECGNNSAGDLSHQGQAVLLRPASIARETVPEPLKFVPFEILITGRTISASFHRIQPHNNDGNDPKQATSWRKLKLRSFRRNTYIESIAEESDGSSHMKLKPTPKQANETSDSPMHPVLGATEGTVSDIGYDASEEGSVDEGLIHAITDVQPLLYFSLMQPHVFVSCSSVDQKIDASVYDLILSVPNVHHLITCSRGRCLPNEQDFTRPVVQTRPGELSRLSGIPPALFTLTAKEFLDKDATIIAKTERPLKINIALSLVQSLSVAINSIQSAMAYQEILQLISQPPPVIQSSISTHLSDHDHLQKRMTLLKRISEISLKTSQIVIASSVDEEGENYCIQSGFYSSHFKIVPKKSPSSNQIQDVSIKADFQRFVARGIRNRVSNYRLIGPWNLKMEAEATFIEEQDQPFITVQVASDDLTFFVGKESLQIVSVFARSFTSTTSPSTSERETLNLSQLESKNRQNSTEQHYADDLRAGAFHFVEKSQPDGDEVKPYQVVFTERPMAMTWKYPKARAISRLTVYPVPFMSAEEDFLDQSRPELTCHLEYWDKCLKSYLPYAYFRLSEDTINHLDLPLISDQKRLRVSDTWRIVLHCEDEDDRPRLIVKPQSLVSVVRVDSFYNAKLIPHCQISLIADRIKLSLVYQSTLVNSVTNLKALSNNQELAALVLESTVAGIDCWSLQDHTRLNFRLNTMLQVFCVDFAMLANHHVILPCKVKANTFVLIPANQSPQMDQHLHLEKLSMRGGHFLADSLKNFSLLMNTDDLGEEHFTALTLKNATHVAIRIGQADTDESLLMRANSQTAYIWRSHKARLMLRCSSENVLQTGIWRWTDPFSLREGVIGAKITHDGFVQNVVISMKKKGATKYSVVINGLIATASLLKENLETRLVLKRNFSFLSHLSPDGKDDLRFITQGNSVSCSHLLETEYVHAIKIRLQGIGTPWSGDIPMETTPRRDSLIVRIPHKDRGKCLNIWCRILQEDVGQGKRFLFIFSPMYVAKSLLPNPLQVLVQAQKSPSASSSSGSVAEMVLEGRDRVTTLETGESPDTKYNLSFKVDEKLPASEPFLLSWGIIEQLRDKNYATPSIDQMIDEIRKLSKGHSNWPFVPEFSMGQGPLNDQPKTDVQVTLTPFHPLLNTVCAEVNPWCLLVNELDTVLLLKVGEKVFDIQPHSIFVPPSLHNETFHFGLNGGEANLRAFFSPPLQLTDQEWHFQSLMPSVDGLVPLEGVCHSKIVMDGLRQGLITIKTKNENGMRVINVVPTFRVMNQLSRTVKVATVSILGRNHECDPKQYDPLLVQPDVSTALLFWQMAGPKPDGLFDGFQHVALAMSDTRWSVLLDLDDCRNLTADVKKNLSLSVRTPQPQLLANHLVSITLHPRNGQVFIALMAHTRTQFTIVNNLAIPLCFTASSKKEKPNVKWSSGDLYLIPPGLSIEANAPNSVTSFTKVEDFSAAPKGYLSTAGSQEKAQISDDHDWELVQKDGRLEQWSEPLDVTGDFREMFLALPEHADIIVHLERSTGMIHLVIDPFSENEVSAKDIRSRIIELSSTEEISEDSVDENSGFLTIGSPSQPEIKDQHSQLTAKSHYLSAIEASSMESSLMTSNDHGLLSKLCWTLACDEISLSLTDDCIETPNQIDEYIRVTLDGITVALRPCVLPVTTSTPQRRPSVSDAMYALSQFSIDIGGLQIDNQMFRRGSYDFPVILKGSRHPKSQGRPAKTSHGLTDLLETSSHLLDEISRTSHLQLHAKVETSSLDKFYVKSVTLQLHPVDLYVEDIFLHKLSQVFKSFIHIPDNNSIEFHPTISDVKAASKILASPLVLESIEIRPINVLVSLHASVKAFVGLDQSPLQFGGYSRQFVQTTSFALGQNIARHYISGTLFRAGWVVGSLEMIGSPAGLTRAVGDGIRDFVALPYNGILHGPWAFLRGVTHGSTSLVKHVSAGTLTSVTNFASSVSRNLDRLSLDSEHCQRNEIVRRNLPQGVGHGLINGLSGIGISILGAIGGLAHHPIKSVIEKGPTPSGLVGGLTRGLVGVVTKPLGGAAEFVAQTGQGLLVGTGWTQRPNPRETSMPQHICTLSSSALKYEWKFGCGTIIMMAEVTMEKGELTPATLLLTMEALIIVSEEEDCQDRVLAIVDAKVDECLDDPTRLIIIPSDGKKAVYDQEDITNERIVQFVMEARGSNFGDMTTEVGKNSEEENLVFLANPITKIAFLDAFQIAKAHLKRFGYPLLM